MKKEYYLMIFLLFLSLRFFLNDFLITIHTIIVFSVPIMYIVYFKHYHIFKFDINDTLQSIVINSLVGFVIGIFLIFFMIYSGNINWINIFDFSNTHFLLLFLLSFNYELLIRYFFQLNFESSFGKIKSIIFASLIGGLILLPDVLSSVTFFIGGLFFGYVFSNTNDIYGVTFGSFLLRVVLSIA